VHTLYKEIVRLLTQGEGAALAIVIEQAGSAPRKSGAQMVIRGNGHFVGSVGGGRLEADCLAAARTVIAEGRGQILPFCLSGTEVAETQMICGGAVEVFIEPLSPGMLDLYTKLLEILGAGKEAVLATLITAEPVQKGGKALVMADGTIVGPFALDSDALRAAHEALQERRPRLILYQGHRIYLEPVFPESTLYLFGAGHISRYIAPLAHMVGFQVIVIDDRQEFANRENFPQAAEIRVEAFAGIVEKLNPDDDAYMVIVTRGHLHDYTVLQQVLPLNCRYIGMIGSHGKRDIIYQQLMQEGHTKADLARVHAPIGLTIGAEAPEEIAVSIVAELIKVRAEEQPVHEKTWEV
jgi:xanthine dehydrogenase accessory factor